MNLKIAFAFFFGLTLSTAAFAGDTNCQLKVADAVRTIMKSDANGNGTISVRESLSTYETFDAEIRALSKVEYKGMRRAIYTYILKHEALPTHFVDLLDWFAQQGLWKYEKSEAQVKKAMNAFYACEE
jgi:hypothetical protein